MRLGYIHLHGNEKSSHIEFITLFTKLATSVIGAPSYTIQVNDQKFSAQNVSGAYERFFKIKEQLDSFLDSFENSIVTIHSNISKIVNFEVTEDRVILDTSCVKIFNKGSNCYMIFCDFDLNLLQQQHLFHIVPLYELPLTVPRSLPEFNPNDDWIRYTYRSFTSKVYNIPPTYNLPTAIELECSERISNYLPAALLQIVGYVEHLDTSKEQYYNVRVSFVPCAHRHALQALASCINPRVKLDFDC